MGRRESLFQNYITPLIPYPLFNAALGGFEPCYPVFSAFILIVYNSRLCHILPTKTPLIPKNPLRTHLCLFRSRSSNIPNNRSIRRRSTTLHRVGRRMTRPYCRLSNLSHFRTVAFLLPLRIPPHGFLPHSISPVADIPPPACLVSASPALLTQLLGYFIGHQSILVYGQLRLVRNVVHERQRYVYPEI